MFSDDDIAAMRAAEAVSADGEKIGPVADVYLDDATGQPTWVTVNSGLFGTKTHFVPLFEASLGGSLLRVGFDKAAVVGSPRLAEDEHLGADEEDRLFAHYGISREQAMPAVAEPEPTSDGLARAAELTDEAKRLAPQVDPLKDDPAEPAGESPATGAAPVASVVDATESAAWGADADAETPRPAPEASEQA